MPKVLAIIPARGGSKGIPRKNIRDLCGKPLVAYSIEVALRSKLINRVIVSTEDREIAEVSESYGAEVPFLRPDTMAGDRSSVADALGFTFHELRKSGYFPNILVTLYPTHPFRTPELVDFLVDKALRGHGPVYTVKPVSLHHRTLFTKNGDKNPTPLIMSRSQNGHSGGKCFFRNYGLFEATNYNEIKKPYTHVIEDTVSLIDIDSWSDFYFAEEVIKEGLFDFGLEQVPC